MADSPRSPFYEPGKLNSAIAHAKAAKAARVKAAKAARAARAAKTARAAKAARAARAATTPRKSANPAITNRPAFGLKLLTNYSRIVVFQDRLSGLCDVTKTEQVSNDTWRASCAKGDAFIIKVHPDGYMDATRP